VWKTLALALTEPDNDAVWDHVRRTGTPRYLNDPHPWLAPGAEELLKELTGTGLRVLEWGAGASTLWLLARGCEVTTIETDARWAQEIQKRGGGLIDVRLLAANAPEYLPDVEHYSMAIIDGRRRQDCARHLLERRFTGVVVWDDTHRAEYREILWTLADASYRQRHFAGVSAQLTPKLTSFFWLQGERRQ